MPENRAEKLWITDVTLREYGQNVPHDSIEIFTPEVRVKTALALFDAGFPGVEVLSFVHEKVAPAMNKKDLTRIISRLGRPKNGRLISLVPNMTGYRRFLEADLGPDGYNHTMGLFFSAVEAHNVANLGKSIQETVEDQAAIVRDAQKKGIPVITCVSATFGYLEPQGKGVTRPDYDKVCDYIDLFFDLGVQGVTLSDLQGVATEEDTLEILELILNKRKGKDVERIGYHPHHVSGERAIANSRVAYDLGIRRFDASLGGTGGCVTGAPGNQPTEGLVRSFENSGIETGVDIGKVLSLAEAIQKELFAKIRLGAMRS
ncbi:MAG: hypothetical protein V2J25_13450 [Desulfatiglans sp.]|nr:hypothetical protein [Desulfatiglans sp.]